MGVETIATGTAMSNRVLIIEDSATNKAILEGILANNGFETRSAANGREGLRILGEWVPNVILLDLVMPEIDLCKYPEIQQVVNTKAPLALEDIVNNPIMSHVKDSIKDFSGMSLLIVPIV